MKLKTMNHVIGLALLTANGQAILNETLSRAYDAAKQHRKYRSGPSLPH